MSASDILRNLKQKNIWIKGLYLAFCSWVLTFIIPAITLLCVAQFLCTLFTGSVHPTLKAISQQTYQFTQQLIAFLCFQTSKPPFPYS